MTTPRVTEEPRADVEAAGGARVDKAEVPVRDTTAVICCYTEERWDQILEAVDSLRTQGHPPGEIVVVVDHNPGLLERLRHALPGDVVVVPNADAPGLSGGRNTALRVARCQLVAFLDDDAVADPRWLLHLTAHFDDATVMGAGGRVTPIWDAPRPPWFPPEFDWVVGCTYEGTPGVLAEVRNPFGGAMVLRRDAAVWAGGYRTDLGRVGKHPLGCEETELCIRLRNRRPGTKFLFDPEAEIHHHVPAPRCSWRYFRQRCYAEGLSKAVVSRVAQGGPALDTERAYVRHTLPRGLRAGIAAGVRGDRAGFQRAGAIVVALTWTVAGFGMGKVVARRRVGLPAGQAAGS